MQPFIKHITEDYLKNKSWKRNKIKRSNSLLLGAKFQKISNTLSNKWGWKQQIFKQHSAWPEKKRVLQDGQKPLDNLVINEQEKDRVLQTG